MAELKEFVNRVLLPVQLSLGLFQIMKTMPLWAVIHCVLASLLDFFHFPFTDYKKLRGFKGRVFKKVISHTTTAGTKRKKQKDSENNKKDQGKSEDPEKNKNERKSEDPGKTPKEEKSEDPEQSKKGRKFEDRKQFEATVKYLGEEFVLQRNHENKMLMMKDGTAYYITDKMWETVKYIEKVASRTVFLKDHKELWEEVVTGDIMEFDQVLDSVILDNREVIRLDNDYFLPVNLLRSHTTLVTTLNFVGLFLKTQNHIHWLIPALLTFASVILGFSTTLRFWIDRLINRIVCKSVQLLYDRLPSEKRRWAYSLGNWVENLKPGNDLKSKTVRGIAILLVAPGAKHDSKSFADLETLDTGDLLVDHVLVGGGAKSDIETSTDSCRSLARLVIVACNRGNIRTFLTGSTKVQPHLSGDDFKNFANPPKEWVRDIWPQVGPFLFKCDSVYIEWIFDNNNQICSLKAGRVAASSESLKAFKMIICDTRKNDTRKNDTEKNDDCIDMCDDDDKDTGKNDTVIFVEKEANKSLIADHFDTSSIDVDCSGEEAIKLLKFAFYMAKYRTTSLKSYDHKKNGKSMFPVCCFLCQVQDNFTQILCKPKKNKVTVRRFVESINAYASSGYPPLSKLIMHDVVVR